MRYVWLTLLVLATSCNNTDTNHTTANHVNDSTVQAVTTTDVNRQDTACYLAVRNRDSILLRLYRADSLITGHMQYDNFEMDGNIGTLQATRRHNRIEGYFRFFSEGMWSVREIVFEQQDDHLVQAQTNDMLYTGDTAKFRDKEVLQFDGQRVFKKVDCRQLHLDALPG